MRSKRRPKVAKILKAAERGEKIANDPTGKIEASRSKGFIKFAVMMDDKSLIVEMPWSTILASSESVISEYILKHMREAREH